MRSTALFIALLLAPLLSGAQIIATNSEMRGFYAGAGVGGSQPYTSSDCYYYSCDINDEDGDSGTAVNVFAGYRFNRFIAVEGGLFNADGLGWNSTLVYLPELLDLYNVNVDLDVRAAHASLLAIVPFATLFEVYLRGGVAYYDADASQQLTPSFGGAVVSRDVNDSATALLIGIGAGVSLPWHLHARIEYQLFDIDEKLLATPSDTSSVDTLMIDLQYRFGSHWRQKGP